MVLPLLGAACSSEPGAPGADAGAALDDVGRRAPDVRVSGAEDVGTRTVDARPAGGSPGANPCMGVTTLGRCASPQRAQYCAISTGRGDERLITQDCDEGETCTRGPDGFRCVRTGECGAGETECSDEQTLRTCMGGMWQTERCATRCVAGAAGAACAPMATTETRAGRFRYQARGVREDLTDWAAPAYVTDQGFAVALQRGEDIVATAVTATDGTFSLAVPTEPTAQDRVLVIPALFRNGAIVLAVGNPGFEPSATARDDGASLPSNRRIWTWSWDLSMLPAEGRMDLDLTTAQGSGAAEAYAWMRSTYRAARDIHGRAGKSLIGWVAPGTKWSCGACYNGVEHRINRMSFESQAWLDGGEDEGYWSSSVTVHEMGHWWMDSYSRSPGEGGPHTVGVATFPGQAWSEGFATFASADLRNDPLYIDKQGGILYIDLTRLRFRNAGEREENGLVRPSADNRDGVMQFLDENWVSAAMWRMRGADAAPLYRALASDRVSNEPFGRCYVRHQWSGIGADATEVCSAGESVPFFADFLDALTCNSFSRTTLGNAVAPYPYDAESAWCDAARQPEMNCAAYDYPMCAAMDARAPLRLTLTPVEVREGATRLRATLSRTGWMPGPYAVSLDLPPGVRRVGGPERFTVPTLPQGGAWSAEIELRHDTVPARDAVVRVSVHHPGIGWNGAAPWRFGRPAPLPAAPARAASTVRLRGLDLGPSVPVLARTPAPSLPSSPPTTITTR